MSVTALPGARRRGSALSDSLPGLTDVHLA